MECIFILIFRVLNIDDIFSSIKVKLRKFDLTQTQNFMVCKELRMDVVVDPWRIIIISKIKSN
jgi:hypothetical protein